MSKRLKDIQTRAGETVRVSNEWAADAEACGSSVSTATWSYSGAGTISGEALSSNLSSVLLSATGSGVLTNTVTLADGQVLIAERDVWV